MKKALIFFFSIICLNTYAQFGESSFGLQYPVLMNPAAAGASPQTEVFVGYRDQWSGLEGAPRRVNAGIQGRLNEQGGVAAMLHSRSWGIFDDMGASFYYAHQLNLGSDKKLRLGLSSHLMQRSVNDNRLDVDNPDADMLLLNNYSNDMHMHFGFGMLYQLHNLTVGLALPGIYNGSNRSMLSNQNFLVMYDFYAFAKDMILRPSLQYNHDNRLEDQQIFSLQALWKKLFWVQAGYNSIGGFMFSTGLQYEKLGINYGYDLNRGNLNGLAAGSHEIMLTFQISKKQASDEPENTPF